MKKKIMAFVLVLSMLMPTKVFAEEVDSNKTITTEELKTITEEVGQIYNIDPELLQAICETESHQKIYAENDTCKGLMQVSVKWHKNRMEKLGVTDIYDPYGNILVAADFLSDLYKENPDTYYVLMRYNMEIKTANELYAKGEITKYAKKIVKRTEELKNS